MVETWHSPRFWDEEHRQQMVKIFDEFIDLALEGTVTMEQAILACKEVIATEAEIQAA